MKPDSILDKRFVAGHYESLLQETFDRGQAVQPNDVPSIVGSLAFCGRQSEAVALYNSQLINISPLQKIVSRFFLGIGWVRQSQFKKAFRSFHENQLEGRALQVGEAEFYIHQGIAFYLFYHGNYPRALKYAKRAQHAAISSQDLFSRTLASDLIGHCQVAMGLLLEGFENLKKASTLAKNANNDGLSHAIELALVLYEAQYGYYSLEIIDKLSELAKSAEYQDSYSFSDLHLELARQYCLRGKFSEALLAIDSATKFVLIAKNRRQEMTLYLRKAEVHYQRAENLDALMLLQSARKSLVTAADRVFELQILGLEIKCLKDSSDPLVLDSKNREIMELSRIYSNHINLSILKRNSKDDHKDIQAYRSSEDKLGLFIDSVYRKNIDFSIIVRSGYLSFLYDYFILPRGQDLVFISNIKSQILFMSKNGISKSEHAPTDLTVKVFLALSTQVEVTRQQFFEGVWGLRYHRQRHDSLIYTTLSLVRKNMGKYASWLQTTDSGYQLSARVVIEGDLENSVRPPTLNSILPVLSPVKLTQLSGVETGIHDIMKRYRDHSLTFRQIKIIKYLQSHDFITTKVHMDIHQITEISANRDLADLYRKKIILRLGKARATKYILLSSD
jgi:hypothetical protein